MRSSWSRCLKETPLTLDLDLCRPLPPRGREGARLNGAGRHTALRPPQPPPGREEGSRHPVGEGCALPPAATTQCPRRPTR
mmetsp:Transcript_37885/g.89979  ORF Transcript_37885/g.89979 Transcript_37885/m.89979 type:complete len:81 (+) Transcript_37885:286-528(+)